jgi:hypothetical protein
MSDRKTPARKKSKGQSTKSPKKTHKATHAGKQPKSDTYTAIANALGAATSEELSALQSSLLKGNNNVAGIPLSPFDAGYLAAQLVAYHKKRKSRKRPKIYLELFFVDEE